MRTRYIRLKKLNPLTHKKKDRDTLNGFGTEGISSPGMIITPRQENFVRSQQLVGMVQETIRRQLKLIHNSIQHEARDCLIQNDLPDYDDDETIDDEVLKQWMTQVCNNVFSVSFNFFSKDQMSLEHTKIFCSESILRNIFRLTQKFNLSITQMKVLNQHLAKDIVPYMQRKYPLNESNDVNKAIDQSVRPVDNRQAISNDMLHKSDIVFTWRKSGDYNDLIMKFLNWIMTEVDKEKQQGCGDSPYEEFYNTMSDLFQNVYDESWMKSRTLEQYAKMDRTTIKKMRMQKHESLSLESKISQQKYANRVKEYTSYAINRKISKNTPIFTDDQIKSGHLSIKNSAILRILTKWCQQLWKKFTTKNYFLDREQNMRVQEVGGNVNTMFMWMKLPLNDLMEQEKKKIDAFMKEVTQHNFDQQSLLLLKQLEDDGFTHVQKIQRACGKYAYKTVNNLHFYIILYLNRVIHGLLTVSKQLYDQKLSTKNRWTSPPDLMSFKVGDLMRCKCSSKEREVLRIFKQLQKISEDQPQLVKIIRIKNRLKMGTNDILINIMFKKKFICEIQLAVKSSTNKFIQCSNMFSHYIYELGRTLFGPITELCSVWMTLDARALEYQRIVNRQKRVHTCQRFGCRRNGKNHNYQTLRRPFICNDCKIAYSSTNYIWSHQKCEECGHMICALCRIENQSDNKLKQEMLAYEDQATRNACISIANRNGFKALPQYGLCIKINSKRIVVQRFKKIEIKNILSVYGIDKNKETGEERITLIKELIKPQAEFDFLRDYLVFEFCQDQGQKLINITVDRAKKQFLIPLKVKEIYKKQKQILSLIEQNLDDKDILIIKQEPKFMEKIRNMEMADNILTRVDFITENFPNLTRLQLSRNNVENIDTISKLEKLVKLNLRDNKLTVLPQELCKLTCLKSLNIRNNKILSLPSQFGNLVNIMKLEADNNRLNTLPKGFEKMTKMDFLNLSKNQLTEFPSSIRSFKNITILKVAQNKWSTIPEWIQQLTLLEMLDLRKTAATNLPDGIFTLKNLSCLKIFTTHINLPAKISDLTNLKELSLQMPSITSLPGQMGNLHQLQQLQLEECKMDQLPDWLSDMKSLISFSLINNKIATLQLEVSEMTKLKYLKIQGQNISELPAALHDLTDLRTLSLNNNKFKIIPDVVKQFKKLYELTISNNQLEYIPDDFFNELPEIETLTFDKNQLKSLPKSLQKLKKMKKLSYKDNPDIKEPILIDNETMNEALKTHQLTMSFKDSIIQKVF